LCSFVQASSDQAEGQERRARRNHRRVMARLSGLTALAVAGGDIAWWREAEARAAEYPTRAVVLLEYDPFGSMVHALAALGRQSEVEAFPTSQTLTVATGRNHQIDSIPTGQDMLLSLIELKNGDLISGGNDGSLRSYLLPEAAIREACMELRVHLVLCSPKTPPEQADRQTCLTTMGF
jgi:hypothetical protein